MLKNGLMNNFVNVKILCFKITKLQHWDGLIFMVKIKKMHHFNLQY